MTCLVVLFLYSRNTLFGGAHTLCTEQPKIANTNFEQKGAKELKNQLMFILQVHHDMTPDELRRVFHVDSHDQGTNINLECATRPL